MELLVNRRFAWLCVCVLDRNLSIVYQWRARWHSGYSAWLMCRRSTARYPKWMLAHCSPSSEWVPDGNTREIKAVRKGTCHPTSRRWLRISSIANKHSATYESIRDYLYFILIDVVYHFNQRFFIIPCTWKHFCHEHKTILWIILERQRRIISWKSKENYKFW